MSAPTKLVFFGNEFPNDDLKTLFRGLHRHGKDRRFRQLATFLEESTRVLQNEVAQLPEPLKKLVPHFENLMPLTEVDFRQGPLGAAMESALLTILELGMFIGHYEAEERVWDLSADRTTLAGLSIGLLAAAGVALSTHLAEVVQNGAECVRVSFRLGVYVHDISRKLEAPQADGSLLSWAHVVTGETASDLQEELSRYNTETGTPELLKVFISAADKTSVSVSGPPSRIRAAFRASQRLRYSKSLALPVYDGLCHAAHLYDEETIHRVLHPSGSVIPTSRPVQLALLSSRSGQPFEATTAAELFRAISTELLTGTIFLDNITAGILDRTERCADATQCQIETYRTSLLFKGLLKALEACFPDRTIGTTDLIPWVFQDYGARQPKSCADSKLAIVGMACRMPGGANDLDLFWELLAQGRDTHTTVPADRFDLETHYDPTGETENATRTPFGNFIDQPGLFDAGFFNMSPREAEQTDPMHRLALVTAYEALEMAGVVSGRTPSSNPKRIATFYGQASDDWRELNASQNIGTYAVPGGERAFANGRINYFFKFGGPSFNLDTACSSGLAAVQAACSALWAGEADTVLAGGLNIITDPDNYAGLGNGHFLSRTGQCKVWDQSADGYCRADGVGSVVIKRLEDAEADNDNILAVVLSAATNHSAEAISITHPHAGAQKENYTQVLHQAAVNPLDVSYVELHGTGTQAGDAQEAESVLDVFAPRNHRRRADQPLYLGAVKSNIGHGEAAAGIASLLKVLLMYQKNEIPAHIGIPTVINPAIPTDLEQRQVHLPRSKTAWPRAAGQIRRAIVNSFGAHGGNTTLVLEDAPEKQVTVALEERSTHPVVISAKSKKSLAANLETLLAYLDEKPETDLGDLSYTTCARRMHHSWRVATAVSDIPALQKFLRNAVNNDAVSQIRPIPTEAPPVVFTFTGQGAYYAGLAQGLFQALPSFRAEVRQLDHLSQRLGFHSIVPVILGEVEEGTSTALVTQLSIVIVEIALARLWLLLLGIPAPHAVIGHSLGEYAALAVAGVLSTADALYLVGHRAQLIEEHCTPGSHAMLSVRATITDIERLVGTGPDAPTYELSCQNTHQDTVIGGSIPDLSAIREKLEPEGIKCVNVDVPFAFHTAQMDAVRERLAKAVAAVPFKTPSVPVLSPLLGSVVFDGKSINPEYIVRATREPVQFATAIDAAQELGIVNNQTLWVDIGPHPICASFVRSLVPGARIVSSCRRNEDNFATMAKSLCTLHLAGRTPSWAEYFRPDEQAYSLLRLPKYRWNEVNYWIQYLGTWTLDKAHIKNGSSQKRAITDVPSVSSLRTSLIHQVTEESVDKTTATFKAISDIQHPDFLEAVHGHTMNNCGVATSSIWTDMAMTVGEHLYRRLVPGTDNVLMDLCDFEVQHAQVANTNSNTPQPLALEAHLDLPTRHMSLAWYDVDATTNQRAAAPFATGSIKYPADPTGAAWSTEWSRITHLIQGRIDALQHMATENKASTLSKPLAYALFKNVVDYAPRYRGMDRVVIHDYEAFSDITLTTDRHGTWHTPPHWIDSVSHLAGLVMNGSDASNTRDFFYVTPGCGSCRMTEPLIPGGKYRNYVRMFPIPDEAHMYAGDLYILREDKIIGVVEQLKFRRVPRLLMDRFFSPNKNAAAHAAPAPAPAAAPVLKKQPPTPTSTETVTSKPAKTEQKQVQLQLPSLTSAAPSTASSSSSPSSSGVATPTTEQEAPVADASAVTGVAGKCLELIANETGLGVSELTADATFVQLGVDSLMSLVLSEKLRSEMGLEIKSSLFLECPTVGDLTGWLEQYC
ncbi:non-reducing polyketide synthase nscA [Aspergillus luchuensis]|uniref:Polyketide synthase n=1 Tax=Aspergillus kawachii TaxID=1069201 RepID=A0A146FQI2_ASPKA|nr:type I iterative PKS [Aspergillus luchuensis]BCS04847.1 type I iterative PKS [Aspergillus luchuensis]BCS16410.1 type I iterative PKS [Aspergillus luchuensis]GAA85937.1 polyketide synthase [Aspergillus luchuensis IFO 4308]GAT28006.1 polyketide synthase [Aspergillus luchuensis]